MGRRLCGIRFLLFVACSAAIGGGATPHHGIPTDLVLSRETHQHLNTLNPLMLTRQELPDCSSDALLLSLKLWQDLRGSQTLLCSCRSGCSRLLTSRD